MVGSNAPNHQPSTIHHQPPYTLRLFGALQPLCGMGVTSLIRFTSSPTAWSDRIAVSLPEPGPFTNTSTRRKPCSMAFRAAFSAAIWAAKGVPFLVPLKPIAPALDHEITSPFTSAMVISVLLNVD